jgi:peptidoglycan/xylan/chitin deacetylase (PgdA/CDA1 family)
VSGFGPKAALREGLIAGLAPLAERAYRERPRVRVLSFHDVLPGPGSPFPGRMRWLADNARVVALASVAERESLDPERLNVILSFDDGYAEHAAFAAPVLAELGLPATFFVPSGVVDLAPEEAQRYAERRIRRSSRTFRFVSSGELAALAAEPLFEIGGHTRSHTDLGAATDAATLADEIAGDKQRLEQLSGRAVRFFAFPFGGAQHTSAAAVAELRRAGYEAAFTILPGFWSASGDPYLVGRDSLSFAASQRSWRGALRGGYDAVSWFKRRRA